MARATDDYRSLSGPQKAAIFMLALDDVHTARIMEMMDDKEIREMSQTMSSLGAVNSDMIERLFVEFADQLSSTGSLVGSYDSTERMLLGSLDPERASQIMEELRGPAGRTMWDKLGNVNEAVLANYFKNEYP
jgi:flagellar motor switch protein FliG